jgi:hypothetical protein
MAAVFAVICLGLWVDVNGLDNWLWANRLGWLTGVFSGEVLLVAMLLLGFGAFVGAVLPTNPSEQE